MSSWQGKQLCIEAVSVGLRLLSKDEYPQPPVAAYFFESLSLSSPASWATETTFQSRYPGGISVTKIGELSLASFFASTASAVALVLSEDWGLAFCACAFCLMIRMEVATAEAIMRATK